MTIARRSPKARNGVGRKDVDRILDRIGERIFRSLQKPKARKALDRAFSYSPKEMGRAALREWRKKHGIKSRG